ncbi:hypothetical protein LJU32_03970 [Pseudomonas sp. B21_DOA]|nr:hypothetical protein LJU32_03970 [Pseudomonas sp. B21_DOA]
MGVARKHQVHLEIFTLDPKVDDFLKNTAGIEKGKRYIHLPSGTVLTKKTPEVGSVTLEVDHCVELSKSPIFKDPTEWYEISVKENGQDIKGLIKKAEAKLVTQHDWEKLGFRVVKESNSNSDGFWILMKCHLFSKSYMMIWINLAITMTR